MALFSAKERKYCLQAEIPIQVVKEQSCVNSSHAETAEKMTTHYILVGISIKLIALSRTSGMTS